MSILAYVGLPGSGKSYSVVEQQVLPALKAGRTVVTNVPLKFDLIRSTLGIPAEQLREFPMEAVAAEPEKILEAAEPGAILILDEVWRMFPAGLKANQVPEPYRAVFAEHRHRVNAKGESTQIVLVTQDLAQIAAFARQLVEQTFRTTKLTALGSQTRYRVDIYAGIITGPNPNTNSAIRQIFGKYKKEVYQYYVSHTQSQAAGDAGADERAVDRRGNIFMRPLMMAAPLIVIALVWYGVHTLTASRDQLRAQSERGAAVGRATAPTGTVGSPFSSGMGAASTDPEVKRAPPRTWRVSAVWAGAGELGGQAWLTDGVVTEWVPLSKCRVEAHQVACPYKGSYWDTQGVQIEGLHAPLEVVHEIPVLPLKKPAAPAKAVRAAGASVVDGSG